MKTNYQQQIRAQAGLPLDGDSDDNEQIDPEEQNEITSTNKILKVTWLSEQVTRDMFASISSEIDRLEEQARTLAYNYNVEQKHLEIINLLVRATELRNIRNTYGK